MDNRIEEVVKIIRANLDEGGMRPRQAAVQIDKYYCQQFPQPLDDKELREKIAGIIATDWYGSNGWARIKADIEGGRSTFESVDAMWGNVTSQILALLPSIEEARREIIAEIDTELIHASRDTWDRLIDTDEWEIFKARYFGAKTENGKP